MGTIRKIIDPEKIDYMIVNYVEPDHSSSMPDIMNIVKPEKLFCTSSGKHVSLITIRKIGLMKFSKAVLKLVLVLTLSLSLQHEYSTGLTVCSLI